MSNDGLKSGDKVKVSFINKGYLWFVFLCDDDKIIRRPYLHETAQTGEQVIDYDVTIQNGETKDKRADARLKALELRAEGMNLSKVAQATGFHAAYVSQLVAKYRDHGLEAISGNHYGGNHCNLSFEEEAAILAPFKARSEKGELVEISEIKKAYQQAVGHSIGTGQIYYALHRHGWRKVMPRSRHPKKASEGVIETSKKLKPLSER